MKRNAVAYRAQTEPTIDKLYEKSMKIQGIAYLQSGPDGNKTTSTIEVKTNNKLLYHCYRRYKSFLFQLDYVYEQSAQSGFYGPNFGEFNAVHALQNGIDYMLYCTGAIANGNKRELPTIQMLFYEKLAAVYDVLCKQNQNIIKINILAINQESAFDLISQTNVQIRQTHNAKNPQAVDICFSGGKQIIPQTLFELFELIKRTLDIKSTKLQNSYYTIYAEILSKQGNGDKKKLILINGTKNIKSEQKFWDNATSLVFNKCILGLYNKMENPYKQSYAPFRDSKITRIIKPFITFNSRVDVIGFLNMQEDDINLSTLNFVKNISRLRVPMKKSQKQHQQKQINPQTHISQQKQYPKTQQIIIKRSPYSRNKLKTEIQQQKSTLMEQVRNTIKAQFDVNKRLQQIRHEVKIIKKRKQIGSLGLPSLQKSQLLQNLQNQQLQFKEQKEKQMIAESQKLIKRRIETINKSISKVEKLKLLKQYYTVAMHNQKQQIQNYVNQQQAISKFYADRVSTIQNDLKKSPKQLLSDMQSMSTSTPKQKRYTSANKKQKNSLPYIEDRNKKRISLVKQKLKKGRVEYSNFLQKNIEQYQSYATPTK